MPPPLAYFLTWTCHGTWLHGDPRGSVDKTHNNRLSPVLPPDWERQSRELERLDSSPSLLSDAARQVVAQTIVRHCAIRGWKLIALNVRTNHVHVVVACGADVPPERAMDQFKAWSTRRLREAGLRDPDTRVWTEHGSTRWINSPESLASAVSYVVEGQDHETRRAE